MNIGEAAKASGVSAKMIRYYEATRLIPSAERTLSGYRTYSENDVHTLGFIRRARNLGFSIEEIGELLALWRDRRRPSRDVKHVVHRHVQDLQRRIGEMQGMVDTLRHLETRCGGDDRPDCPILADLASADGRSATLAGSSAHRLGRS